MAFREGQDRAEEWPSVVPAGGFSLDSVFGVGSNPVTPTCFLRKLIVVFDGELFTWNHFPCRSLRRSNAARWWYCETALLRSLHSRNRCADDQKAIEIRHREGGRMTHENLPRLLRRIQRRDRRRQDRSRPPAGRTKARSMFARSSSLISVIVKTRATSSSTGLAGGFFGSRCLASPSSNSSLPP
jgi:hypothetical protein